MGVGPLATEDPTAEEAAALATGTTATEGATTTTMIATTTTITTTTGGGTDHDRETGTETQGGRAGIETAGAIDPGPATGPLAGREVLATGATATTTIRDARGTTTAGAQGATALPSTETVSLLEYLRVNPSPTTSLLTPVMFTTDYRRRSASPGRSPSPPMAELPTRHKTDTERSNAQPFVPAKGDGRDGETGRARGRGREDSYHDEGEDGRERDDPPRRSREDGAAEPMDEDDDLAMEEDGMDDMAAMMGFGGFGSTKGKKVVGNNVGAVRKEKKTEYRQYMNRVGGFNRPLSPSR